MNNNRNHLVQRTARKLIKSIDKELNTQINYTTALRILDNLNVEFTTSKNNKEVIENKNYKNKQNYTLGHKNSDTIMPIWWDSFHYPHLYIEGAPGTGKTVLLNKLVEEFLEAGKEVHVFSFSGLKPINEFMDFEGKENFFFHNDYRTLKRTIQVITEELKSRYEIMKQLKVNNYHDLPESIKIDNPEVFVCVDELNGNVLYLENYFKKEYISTLHYEFVEFLESLLRIGRAAGFHLIITNQFKDSKIITLSFYSNFTALVDTNPIIRNGYNDLTRWSGTYQEGSRSFPENIKYVKFLK